MSAVTASAAPRRNIHLTPIIWGIALAAIAFAPLGLKNYGVYLLTLWSVYVMAGMGLNLTVGYAGQMSIGHAAFLGVGAYTAAILMKIGFSFWLVLPLAALLCFIVLMSLFFRNEEWLTGGTFGISGIQRPAFFGLSLDGSGAYFYFTYVSTILLALVLWWLIRSPWGRAFAALRDNPIRAESLGVNIMAYTLLAFAIGAAFAGVAGTYFAALVQFIEPAPFSLTASLMMLLMVIVGGAGRFFGPMLGAAIVILLPEWLRFLKDWYLVMFGLAVVALMIWLPGGLLSIPERLRRA